MRARHFRNDLVAHARVAAAFASARENADAASSHQPGASSEQPAARGVASKGERERERARVPFLRLKPAGYPPWARRGSRRTCRALLGPAGPCWALLGHDVALAGSGDAAAGGAEAREGAEGLPAEGEAGVGTGGIRGSAPSSSGGTAA